MCSFGTVGGEKSHVLQIFLCDDATFPFFFFLFVSFIFSQVMAKWWDEAVLLRIGLKLEQFRYQTKKPCTYYDILA